MAKTYEIDNTLEGSPDLHKVRNFYNDLRSKILAEEPIQSSENTPLVLVSEAERAGNYGWELYKAGASLVMLEYEGNWTGYAQGPRKPPAPSEAWLHNLKLTIQDSTPELEAKIEKLIAKYPSKSKKRQNAV